MPPRETMADAIEEKYIQAQNAANEGSTSTAPQPQEVPQVIHQTIIVQQTQEMRHPRGICDTWVLAIALGWMGAHHFYLRRPGWGCLYMFTFGLLGVGWIVDVCRVPCLVSESNRQMENPTPDKKSLFDAYVLWFPFGLFGAHHFYLRRWGWGVAYLLTFGLLGIGWLIDFFRLPCLVRDHNNNIDKCGCAVVIQVPADHVNPGGDVYVQTAGWPQSPPYTLAPNQVHLPATASLGPNQPYPGYGAVGQSSWSSIDSSDVGIESVADLPPSYEASMTGPQQYRPQHPAYQPALLSYQPTQPAQPCQVHEYRRQAPPIPSATETKTRES